MTLSFRREWVKPRNYIDFARAALGGCGLVSALTVGGGLPLSSRHSAVLIQAVIVLGGLLIQLIRREHRRVSLAAPVFYIGGITLALHSPLAAVCAFAIAWLFSPIAPNPLAFLTVYTVVLGVVGFVVGGYGALLILAIVTSFLPVVISLLARQPLMVLSRRALSASRGAGA